MFFRSSVIHRNCEFLGCRRWHRPTDSCFPANLWQSVTVRVIIAWSRWRVLFLVNVDHDVIVNGRVYFFLWKWLLHSAAWFCEQIDLLQISFLDWWHFKTTSFLLRCMQLLLEWRMTTLVVLRNSKVLSGTFYDNFQLATCLRLHQTFNQLRRIRWRGVLRNRPC